jgi:tetratricopeptide (TPR) repeat protein
VTVESQEEKFGTGLWRELQRQLRQQWVMLALLALLAVLFFVGVAGLSRAYHAQRESLGERWFSRGLADLNAQHYDGAVMEFRSALIYSRDNYAYQLNLAQALVGAKRTSEASTYLLNLWDRQPEDGVVNLALARIAEQRGQVEQSIRYYHNAIYAAWPGDQEALRRDARLELIQLLLSTSKKQAQPELIALEENLGDDPSQQERVGDLFLRVQDYEHALAAYRVSLKQEGNNSSALAGAGLAAFQLGRYPLAQRYLQAAVAGDPADQRSSDLLATTELVIQMDPFRRKLSVAERDKTVVAAFSASGDRLRKCDAAQRPLLTAAQSSLADSWAQMRPRISELNLKRNPDLVEEAMNLVF